MGEAGGGVRVRQSVAVASTEYLRIVEYVEGLPHGATVEYREVETALGVPMATQAQRQKLRRAILRVKREYSAVPGVGYQLADVGTAMPILAHRLTRVDNAVKRADRSYEVINGQFYDDLPREQQEAVRFLGSVFGAIRVAAANGRKLYQQPRPALAQSGPVINIPL